MQGKCTSFNLQRNYRWQNLAILTDSQTKMKALTSNQVNSKLVWKYLKRLNTLGSHNKIWILWFPGHAGLEGNKAANELAKKGASTLLRGSLLWNRKRIHGYDIKKLRGTVERSILSESTRNGAVQAACERI